MHKAEVTSRQQTKARLRVGVDIGGVVEGIMASDQIRSIEDRVGRPEHVNVFKKVPPADFSTGSNGAWIRQTSALDVNSLEHERADKTYRRMLLGHSDHTLQALGKNPIVTKHHLAVFARGGNLT